MSQFGQRHCQWLCSSPAAVSLQMLADCGGVDPSLTNGGTCKSCFTLSGSLSPHLSLVSVETPPRGTQDSWRDVAQQRDWTPSEKWSVTTQPSPSQEAPTLIRDRSERRQGSTPHCICVYPTVRSLLIVTFSPTWGPFCNLASPPFTHQTCQLMSEPSCGQDSRSFPREE